MITGYEHIHLHLLLLLVVAASLSRYGEAEVSRDDFPPGFVFGAGTSAYQVEGAAAEDGRKPSIWDTYVHAGRVMNKSTADIATDQYHKYKEDVKLMEDMGLDAYRFSISWSRLIPDGRGEVNLKGLQYYNNLINELVSRGIEPHVTLNHFDLPQVLEDEYGGYLSPKLIEDFTAYADVCFREFGDRVKSWITFNEPNILTVAGYDLGVFPPARCSYPFGLNCSEGNSSTEVYISAHYILLSHAAAAQLYKEKYQEKQSGYIGITLLAIWFEPFTNASHDVTATDRLLDFHLGWFLDPLVYGDYPANMGKNVGSRLPLFTVEESKQLKGSFDFIGLNHYSVLYGQGISVDFDKNERDYLRDISANISNWVGSIMDRRSSYGYCTLVGGNLVTWRSKKQSVVARSCAEAEYRSMAYGVLVPNGQHFGMKGFVRGNVPLTPPTPWGLQRLLEYVKQKYKNPAVLIHENGYGVFVIDPFSPQKANDDVDRAKYLKKYIESLLPSIRNGSDIRGYFVWSFMDCFEWMSGYNAYFGLYNVDFHDKERRRYPRLSAQWYSSFLKNTRIKRATSSSYLFSE